MEPWNPGTPSSNREPDSPTIKDFESAIAELETIVKTLEEGDLALEHSLELFERGVQLSRFCHAKLEAAERRIEILNERGEVRAGAGVARPRSRRHGIAVSVTAESLEPGSRHDATRSSGRWSAIFRAGGGVPPGLNAAMRYSLLAGGKRLRPMLVLAAAEACGARVGLAPEDAGSAGDAGGLRDRVDPHLLARSTTTFRRWTTTRCGAAVRRPTSSTARGGDPRRRRAADRSVRAARARRRGGHYDASPASSRPAKTPGGPDRRGGRRRRWHGRRPGARSARPPRTRRTPLDRESLARDARAQDRRADPGLGRRRRGHGGRETTAMTSIGRCLRREHRPRLSDRRRHPRRRGCVGDLGKTAGQGCGRRQADLSRALRPRRIATAGGIVYRTRARIARARQPRRSAAGHRALGRLAYALKSKTRLDVLLVERGLAASRERARALILAGQVRVDGQPVTKAGDSVPADADVTVDRSRSSLREPRRPQARPRARRLRHRRQRSARARHRRLDGRIHRRAAPARRAARRRARRRPRPARLEAAERPASDRHRARERADADRRSLPARRARLRHRHDRRVVHLAAPHPSGRPAAPRRRRRRRRPGQAAVRGRPRRSRQGGHRARRRRTAAGRRGRGAVGSCARIGAHRHGRNRRSPAWKATARF